MAFSDEEDSGEEDGGTGTEGEVELPPNGSDEFDAE